LNYTTKIALFREKTSGKIKINLDSADLLTKSNFDRKSKFDSKERIFCKAQRQKMPAVFMAIIFTKTCRGKVMKEKLKTVKTKNYFLLPNSSFRHC